MLRYLFVLLDAADQSTQNKGQELLKDLVFYGMLSYEWRAHECGSIGPLSLYRQCLPYLSKLKPSELSNSVVYAYSALDLCQRVGALPDLPGSLMPAIQAVETEFRTRYTSKEFLATQERLANVLYLEELFRIPALNLLGTNPVALPIRASAQMHLRDFFSAKGGLYTKMGIPPLCFWMNLAEALKCQEVAKHIRPRLSLGDLNMFILSLSSDLEDISSEFLDQDETMYTIVHSLRKSCRPMFQDMSNDRSGVMTIFLHHVYISESRSQTTTTLDDIIMMFRNCHPYNHSILYEFLKNADFMISLLLHADITLELLKSLMFIWCDLCHFHNRKTSFYNAVQKKPVSTINILALSDLLPLLPYITSFRDHQDQQNSMIVQVTCNYICCVLQEHIRQCRETQDEARSIIRSSSAQQDSVSCTAAAAADMNEYLCPICKDAQDTEDHRLVLFHELHTDKPHAMHPMHVLCGYAMFEHMNVCPYCQTPLSAEYSLCLSVPEPEAVPEQVEKRPRARPRKRKLRPRRRTSSKDSKRPRRATAEAALVAIHTSFSPRR
jgi:hypothetical protein